MREIEFLPPWYPAFRRRRRLVVTQAWTTAVILGAILVFGVAAQRSVLIQENAGTALQNELTNTRSELKMLDQQLALKKQLDKQGEILNRVGLQVEFTRLLGELDQLMGHEMFLSQLDIGTEETFRAETAPANKPKGANDAKSANPSSGSKCDRKLKVRLVAVAPSDVDVANFLSGLTNKPYLDQVAMTYAKDRSQQRRVMREFELTFLINLNSSSAE